MQRFSLRLAAVALCFLALAVGKAESGLSSVVGGEYSRFTALDEKAYGGAITRLCNEYERVDVTGDEQTLNEILLRAHAVVKRRENVGEILTVYAYSPRLGEGVDTRFGRVNLMLALSGGRITAGSPLIKGSY